MVLGHDLALGYSALGYPIDHNLALGYSWIMNCPHCGEAINAGKLLGSLRTDRKKEASKLNGKLGGRPAKAPTMPHAASQPTTQPQPASDVCAVCGKPSVRKAWINGAIVGVCGLHY